MPFIPDVSRRAPFTFEALDGVILAVVVIPAGYAQFTPATKGAQQPGMTGQVKEDILSRFGELGVFVRSGRLNFNPRLLRKEEFLKEPETFRYIDAKMVAKDIEVNNDSLCFTYCQIPVVYQLARKDGLRVEFSDGKVEESAGLSLDSMTSKKVFERTGEINQIIVSIKK